MGTKLMLIAMIPLAVSLLGEAQTLSVSDGIIKKVGNQLSIESAEMRAVFPSGNPQGAILNFTYLGPSKKTSKLADGEVRQQLGLKLRAQDICNLVYVMWRFQPEEKLVVSVKRNLGKSTSHQCADDGYVNLQPTSTAPIPRVAAGEPHTLEAHIRERELKVLIDGTVVWVGQLPSSADLVGPVGIRSDNVRAHFTLSGVN